MQPLTLKYKDSFSKEYPDIVSHSEDLLRFYGSVRHSHNIQVQLIESEETVVFQKNELMYSPNYHKSEYVNTILKLKWKYKNYSI